MLMFLQFWSKKCKVGGRLSPEAAVLGDGCPLPLSTCAPPLLTSTPGLCVSCS